MGKSSRARKTWKRVLDPPERPKMVRVQVCYSCNARGTTLAICRDGKKRCPACIKRAEEVRL